MKKLFFFAIAIATACVAEETPTPTFSAIHRLCKAEGHKVPTFGKCLGDKLDKYYPSWKTEDEDSKDVQWYLYFANIVGDRVKKKQITEAAGNQLIQDELLALASKKQQLMQTAMAAQERQRVEEQNKRLIAQQQEYEERQIRERQDQVEAIAKFQAEQQRMQRNQQMINSGVQLMQLGQPRYAPAPTMVFPQETTINVQQPNTYRFYDSRPYR
jgi:hypothetical protein